MDAYGDAADWLGPMIADFDAAVVQDWARELGQSLFTGSTGRVFPKVMKASPLLRAWLGRLESAGRSDQDPLALGRLGRAMGLAFDTVQGRQTSFTADVDGSGHGRGKLGAVWGRMGLWAQWILHAKGLSL